MEANFPLTQKDLLTAVLCVSLVSLAVCVHYRYKKLFTYWSNKGVKGPKPIPILGNLHQILIFDRLKFQQESSKKYGKVFGTYKGGVPDLVVADAEMIRQICIKDFDAFVNHNVENTLNKYQRSFIFMLQDDHWRRVRALMSPTFTSGKIKRMFRMLDGCADDLVKSLAEQFPRDQQNTSGASAIVNMKDIYSMFAIDAISTCCYGLKFERKGSTDLKTAASRNDLVQMALSLMNFKFWRVFAAWTVPRSMLKFLGFEVITEKSLAPFVGLVERLMTHRKISDKKFDDYLQLLLDTKLEQELELDELDQEENHHAGLTHESIQADQKRMVEQIEAGQNGQPGGEGRARVCLSDLEITTGAMFLLTVGLETTSALLTHCSYALAFHQEIQRKLYEEIKRVAEYNEDKSAFSFDYAKLTSCEYLDSVVSETLRLLSPAPVVDRKATRDYHLEKYNIDIPKGSSIILGLRAVHTDPDYWREPTKFDPERFMPGNRENIVPGSYCPFGLGPRHCLGMRFSLTETKLALAKILMNYRTEPAPGLSFPPEGAWTFPLFNIRTPLVTLVKRN